MFQKLIRKFGPCLLIATILATNFVTSTPRLAQAQTTNLALNKPTTSSANETAAFTPNLAVDGNTGTRWSSPFSDPQWIRIDLGTTMTINRVVLRWETAFGRAYQIQTSNNGTTWTTIFSTTTGNGAVDDLTGLSGSGRFIRMNGTARGTQWGYSLFEFEVFGAGGGATPTPTRTNTPGGPTATPTRTPTPNGTGPTAAQLLAKLSGCTQISNGLYRTDSGSTPTIPVCQKTGAVFWKADMDIDCDGQRTTQCNENTDCCFLPDTAFHTSNNQPLNAAVLPYVVVPSSSSIWNFQNFNIQGGAVVAVIFNNRVEYAVVGDTGPNEIIGEASYATANDLGIDPNPSTGGTNGVVTYLIFQGSRVNPIESHSAAVGLGQQLAQQFLNNN